MTTREQIERLTDALDEVPVTDEDARATVERLGIDVPTWAAEVRARIKRMTDAEAQQPLKHAGAVLEAPR